MRSSILFFILAFLIHFAQVIAQPVILGSEITNGITTGGCGATCVPTYCSVFGTGNHATVSIPYDISVPGGTYISLNAVSNMCITASGLDVTDDFIVNGVTTGPYASDTPVNYNGCFYNPCPTPKNLNVTLVVNRRDETVTINWSFSPVPPGGSCIPLDNPVVPAFTQILPICTGGSFVLPTTSTNGISGTWSPAPNNSMTTTYTFTPGGSACAQPVTMTVQVNPAQNASFSFATFCAGGSNGPTGIVTPGGTFSFSPPPGGGTTINPTTGVISGAVGGNTYNVTYTTPGPCPGTSTIPVTVTSGPVGTLTGSATLCPGQCASFSFNFSSGSPPFTINLTANPPGFALPPIPGITAASTFMICYNGTGFVPTFDLATLTVSIPTFFTGSGSLTLTGISDASGCPGMASGSFNLTLTSAPTAQNAGPLTACGDASGQAVFDLTSLNNTIRNGNGSLSVNWFANMAGTIPISNPGAYMSGPGTVYASVSNANCSSALVPVTLNVNTGNVPFNNMVCAQSGTSSCTLCVVNGQVSLSFLFGDNNSYTVTVRDLSTALTYSGVVSNSVGLTVPVSSSTTFELVSVQPLTGCPSFQTFTAQVAINVVNAPILNQPIVAPACQSVLLPPITGSFMSGNQAYFTGPNGTGTMYPPGSLVYSSQILYVFDTNGGCSDQKIINIIVDPLVTYNEPMDLSGCVSAVLPPITGTGISSGVFYNTNSNGTGTVYLPGATVSQSLTLYIYDPNANQNCVTGIVDIVITINPLPPVPTYNVNCAGGPGNGIISVTTPTGSNFEYSIDGGPYQSSAIFSSLGNGGHIVKVRNSQTGCENQVNFQINCNCSIVSTVSIPANTGNTCALTPFNLNNISFGGAATSVTISTNGQGTITPMSSASSPFNVVYSPSANDIGKTVNITFTTNDPDGAGPCDGEIRTFILSVDSNPNGSIAGNIEVCKGANLTLTASGGQSYQWSGNGGNNSTVTFNNILSSGSFTVTLTDANGCKDTVSHAYTVKQISAGRDTSLSFCKSKPETVNLNNFLAAQTTKGGVWTYGTTPITNPLAYPVTDLPAGMNILYYLLDDPVCGKDTALYDIDIRSFNNAGNDNLINVCASTTLPVDFTTALGIHDTGGNWLQPSGINLDFSLPNRVIVSSLNSTIYAFRYIIPDNGCKPDTATVNLNVLPFKDAGADVNFSSCLGSDIDLLSLVKSNFKNGRFLNPNNYSGLNADIWKTTGASEGTYSFYYEVQNTLPCAADTAKITIILRKSLNPGNAQTSTFCEGQTINLNNYLSGNADAGGVFYLQNQAIPGGIFNPSPGINNYMFRYEVGDGALCPKVDASITLSAINKPNVQVLPLITICEGSCRDLIINHNASANSILYLSNISAPSSMKDKVNIVLNASNQQKLNICASVTGPFSFYKIQTGQNITFHVDSIKVPDGIGCRFYYNFNQIIKAENLPTKNISPQICKTSTFTLGSDVYSFTKPSGVTRLVASNSDVCDTLVTVNLKFYPEPAGTYSQSFCDDNATVTIGGETFRKSRPSGTVTLKGAAKSGCDSLVNVILKFEKTISTGTYTFATCNEQYEYKVGGQTFNKANPAGQVLLTGAAAKSCDSLLNVQLIFSDFDVMQTIVYNCGSADASLRFSSASHTGPYTISIDGINSPVFQTLPGGVAIKPGAHNIVFSNTEGCKKSFALNVDDTNAPEVTLSQTPANDGTVQINVVALQNTIYDLVWTPSNTLSCKNCTDPIANPPETTTYTLNYNFGKDCNDNRSITIEREIIDVIIPNIFSPDGNGTNDIFYVQLPDKVNGTVKSMNIYDRWGNLVFAAKDRPASVPAEGWNGIVKGIAVQPGVYVYYIELQLTGSQLNDIFSGTVIVIR